MSYIQKIIFQKGHGTRPEGQIFIVGLGAVLIYLAYLGLSWFWSVEYFQKILSLTATRFIVGRPGGVYFGYVLNLSYGVNIAINFFVDALAVFLFYPLFVLSIEDVEVFRPLKKFVDGVHKTAKANYQAIKTYGILGLALFVLFPLWGTGPIVGCVIGFMMGLRPWVNMSVVLSATLCAIILWSIVSNQFYLKLLEYSSFLPVAVIILLFVITIGIFIWRKFFNKH